MKYIGKVLLLLIMNPFWVVARVPLNTLSKNGSVEVYNIKDYGAVGDGKALNTGAINKAINACIDAGGGIVFVPPGRFLTGTIQLKSNVTLYLDNDATIIATEDKTQFTGSKLKPQNPDQPINLNTKDTISWTSALVLIDKAENVTITGGGTIDGAMIPAVGRHVHGILAFGAKKIDISNIRVTRAGNWSIVGLYVENFKVTNVTVTDGYDGIHIRQGKNILIKNCKLYCRDDAIAGGYWENTVITDCLLNSACNGIRLILPATNLEISYCDIIGPGVFGHHRGTANNPWITNTLTGIILQPGAWGIGKGRLDNIYIHDIKIKDVQTALTFVLNEGNTADNILVENVAATGIYHNACSVEAWPAGSIFKNIKFKNLSVSYQITDRAFINIKDFDRPHTESRPVPYWGFYVRGVKNIQFENLKMSYTGVETRPLMGFDKVENVLLRNVAYKNVPGVNALKYNGATRVKLINFKSQ